MADNEKKTFRVEELALPNSLTLAALLELLEEHGIIRREEVSGASNPGSEEA